MNVPASGGSPGPVAIVCGAGLFPYAVADAVIGAGRRAVLIGLHGFADPQALARYPHHWCHVGQLGRFLHLVRAEGCIDVVLIGGITRPLIRQLRLDGAALRFLPRILAAYYGGDMRLLAGVGDILERVGLKLHGAHELAPGILVPEGMLGVHAPAAGDNADIARGFALLATLGHFDIGQAAVIAGNRVVAVEAAEGTDRMLKRIAELRREGVLRLTGRTGVLVKAPKPQQDRRFDMPAVGVQTVEAAAAAGLAGIGLEAQGAICAELQEMIRAADRAGLFLVGVAPLPAATRTDDAL